MSDESQVVTFLENYWKLLATSAAFFAAYLQLKFKVNSHGERLDKLEADFGKRLDVVRDNLREDIKEVRDDIKRLLLHVGGGK